MNLRKRSLATKMESGFVYHYEGAFTDGTDIYNIKTVEGYLRVRHNRDVPVPDRNQRDETERNAELLIYRLSDMKRITDPNEQDAKEYEKGHTWCGSDHLEFNRKEADKVYRTQAHNKPHTNPLEAIADKKMSKRNTVPNGCPKTKKVVYTGVVADCSYHAIHGDAQKVTDKILDNWNIASAIFEQSFNVQLGLIEIITMPTCGGASFNQAFSNGYTIKNRLSDFSKWRGESKNASAGLWHLMSNGSTLPTVGLAWLNMLCQTTSFDQQGSSGTEYVSGTAVSTVTSNEWMVVAHETGHNFGANHDCTEDLCKACATPSCTDQACVPCDDQCDCKDKFIMAPKTSIFTNIGQEFTATTIRQICTKNPVLGTCLAEPGTRSVLNTGICGNGLKDGKNEQCDPGADTNDPCCFTNCTLRAGKTCSDKNDNCCRNCEIIPKAENKLCRAAQTECDVPEFCQGNATCPADAFREDGLVCTNATGFAADALTSSEKKNLKCASGACTSRKLQCRLYGDGNVDSECPGTQGSCIMFCRSKYDGCIKVANFFRNGSACGTTGFCNDGTCTDPDAFGAISQWFIENQTLGTVLFVGIALILLVLFARFMQKMKTDKRVDIIEQARLEADELERFEKFEKEHRKEEKRRAQQQGAGSRRASVFG